MPSLAWGGNRIAVPASLLATTVLAALAVGAVIGLGQPLIAAVAALPLLVVSLLAVGLNGRWLLVLFALGASYVGGVLTDNFSVGPINLWIPDVVIAIAVAGWLADWFSRPSERRPRLPRAAVLGVPLLFLAIALLTGAERGSERYGASLIGMPLRLVIYAAIATAMTNITPRQALRGLTVVFYSGAVYQAGLAAYHIATGTSATDHLQLSTGGIRYIGLGPATYAGVSVILALLNLARAREHRAIHLGFLALSCLVVLVAYFRTIWLIVGIELIVCLALSREMRRVAISSLPVVVPFLVIAMLAVVSVKPDLVATFTERLSTPASQDSSVQWRAYAYQAVLSGVDEERLLGVGFGRTTSFSLNNQPNYITGDPHNGYIYVYAGGGLLALAALILVMLVYLWDVARRWRWADDDGRTLLALSLAMWVLFMGHAASEPVFTEPQMLLTIWIATLLPALVARRPSPSPMERPSARALRMRSVAARRPEAPLAHA